MISQDQVLELLQRQLAGDGTAGGAPDGAEPGLGQFAQLLSQREEHLRQQLAEAERAEVLEEDEARRLVERRERAETVRQHLADLTAQLDHAHALLDDLSAALGACSGCFGTDDTCRWCRGRGGPGFCTPDRDHFDRLVLPAVRLHARLYRQDSATDRPPTREGNPA